MKLKEVINEGIRIKKEGGRRLAFLAGCVVDENLYFSAWHDNGFYKFNLNTGQCSLLKVFDREPENQQLFGQAIYFEGTIWFIPAYAQNIVKVNLETLDITYIGLPNEGREIMGKRGIRYGKFKCCYQEGKAEFWLVPIGYNMLLHVDMITGQVREFKELRENLSFKDGSSNFSDACFGGDRIWMCPRDSERLVMFDTGSGEFQFYPWRHSEEAYRIIKNYKDWMIFLPHGMGKDMLLLDYNSFEEKRIMLDVNCEAQADFMYLVGEVIGKHLVLVPFLAHEYVAVDMETGEVQADRGLHEYAKSMLWGPERFQSCIAYGDKRLFTSDEKSMPLLIYDIKDHSVSYVELALEWADYERFLRDLYKENRRQFYKWIRMDEGRNVSEEDLPLSVYCTKIDDLRKNMIKARSGHKTMGESIFLSMK